MENPDLSTRFYSLLQVKLITVSKNQFKAAASTSKQHFSFPKNNFIKMKKLFSFLPFLGHHSSSRLCPAKSPFRLKFQIQNLISGIF